MTLFEKLRGPATPKMVLVIFAILIGASLAPFLTAYLAVGNISTLGPVWVGVSFVGFTLLALLMTWRWPQYALLPFLLVSLFLALGMVFITKSVYWPARLFWTNSPVIYLLTALWVLCLMVIIWRAIADEYRHRGQSQTFSLQSLTIKKIAFVIPIVITGFLLLQSVSLNIANIAYLIPQQSAQLQLEVVEKIYQSRGGRFGRGIDIILTLQDQQGHQQKIILDDTFEREVGIFPKSSRSGSKLMGLCWNQEYKKGDILTIKGRQNFLGFAIDQIEQVQRQDQLLCRDGRRII